MCPAEHLAGSRSEHAPDPDGLVSTAGQERERLGEEGHGLDGPAAGPCARSLAVGLGGIGGGQVQHLGRAVRQTRRHQLAVSGNRQREDRRGEGRSGQDGLPSPPSRTGRSCHSPPVITLVPSGEMASARTASVWPASVRITLPLLRSKTLTVLSAEAV